MKKLLLISAIAVMGCSGLVQAQDYGRSTEYREDYRGYRRSDVRAELDRLNYRFERVRDRLRREGGGYLWREYNRLSRDRDRLTWQIRRHEIDPDRARVEIDRIREGLRRLDDRVGNGGHYPNR